MSPATRHIFRISSCLLLLGMLACQSMPMRAIRGARYYAQGSEALDQGDSTRAIDALRRAAELVPQASEIQNHLGLAYWAAGQPEQARSAFDRALELDCDNQAARANRSRLAAVESVVVGESVPQRALDSTHVELGDFENLESLEDKGRTRHGG